MKKLLIEVRRDDPAGGADMAYRRTASMVAYWGRHLHTMPATVLAASCYLQGVEDCFKALEKKPPEPIHFVPEKPARFRPM